MGSRYGKLKQVDPVGPNGETIMDYSIYDAKRAGFETVVFVIKEVIAEEFKEKIGNSVSKHMEVRYAYQELDNLPEGFEVPENRVKPWGTGHAVLSAKDKIDAPFAVINADDFYGANAFKKIYDYLSETPSETNGKLNLCMVGFALGNTVSKNGYVSRGVCQVTSDDKLESIVERTRIETYENGIHYYNEENADWVDLAEEQIVSMNLWGLNEQVLELSEDLFTDFLVEKVPQNIEKAEFYLPSIIETILDKNFATVKVLKSDEKWYGVTYQEDKHEVVEAIKALIAAGKYPEKLWD